MKPDPRNLVAFCEAISEWSHDDLTALDREGLEAMASALRDLKRTVDQTLLKLSFLRDEKALN